MRERFGLLGAKLGHSYSPRIHRELGDYAYDLLEVTEEEIPGILRDSAYRGLNVTIPYKQTVMPYLDVIDPKARAIGSVNTIVRGADGTLTGHNTDDYGFRSLLAYGGIHPTGKKCLVLGSGGASKTVVACLRDMGAREVRIISRTGEDNYQNLDRHRDAEIIVNTTPVGMFPKMDAAPLSLAPFPKLEGVADLIYNPSRTLLLQEAERLGIPCVNGLYMLVAQAREASELFQNISIPEETVLRIVQTIETELNQK